MKRITAISTLWCSMLLAIAGNAWSEEPKQPPKEITNSIGMKLVLIPAGEFMMGNGESAEDLAGYLNRTYGTDHKADYFKDEYPQHRVRITKPFYLGQHEVTVGQFRKFLEDSGDKTEGEKDGKGGFGVDLETGKFSRKPEYTWRNPGFPQTDDHPMVDVSWNDAVAFCEWLSRKERTQYRLPTEAQWEYACRAGTTTRYSSGDVAETLAQVGNVADAVAKAKFPTWQTISASDGYLYTAPVGRFRPNAFGLYDMHGNVTEWCADWWDSGYYGQSPPDDPAGPAGGLGRVIRGGGWYSCSENCRSAYRERNSPDNRGSHLGFRVARVAD